MQPHKPDPYCLFKTDAARERALRYRERTRAWVFVSAAAIMAVSQEPNQVLRGFRWLITLLGFQ